MRDHFFHSFFSKSYLDDNPVIGPTPCLIILSTKYSLYSGVKVGDSGGYTEIKNKNNYMTKHTRDQQQPIITQLSK